MLLALTKQVMIIEAAIVVVIVALLVAILVLNQKKRRAAKAPATASANSGPGPSYYADLQQERTSGQPDPFAGFSGAVPSATPPANGQGSGATAPAANGGGLPAFSNGTASNGSDLAPQPVSALPADPPAFQAPAMPPVLPPSPAVPGPGTPAGWLPDPSGAADTLRYWDGSGWTQHVAQRTGAAS